MLAVLALISTTLATSLAVTHPNLPGTRCLNNLRQLAVALTAYTTDNQDRFPPNRDGTGADVVSVMDVGTGAQVTALSVLVEAALAKAIRKALTIHEMPPNDRAPLGQWLGSSNWRVLHVVNQNSLPLQ